MKALITTTINVPHNLSDWANLLNEDDHIIVAGDMKTPQDDVDYLPWIVSLARSLTGVSDFIRRFRVTQSGGIPDHKTTHPPFIVVCQYHNVTRSIYPLQMKSTRLASLRCSS